MGACVCDVVSGKKNNPDVTWDAYFMGMAVLAAKRSDDPHTKVRLLPSSLPAKLRFDTITALYYNNSFFSDCL